LDAAAARRYWNSRPEINVPATMVYAVAWQESGWQSTIMACDGGIGTMQVMPNTATWMNQRFGTSFDVHTLSGNAFLGGQYLAWLVAYFGEVYFDSQYEFYDESTGEVLNEVLLNSVISAYNVGYGAVDPTKPAGSGIPNWRYVNNVRALMRSCPCAVG
jgi:soluble lytic murein transglycosylase-like protein